MRWRCWWSGVWWQIRVLGLLLVATALVGGVRMAGPVVPAVPVRPAGPVRVRVLVGLVLWMLVM